VQTLTVSENRERFFNIQAAYIQAQGDLGNYFVSAFILQSFIGDINDL
jgi:hypothetical protein